MALFYKKEERDEKRSAVPPPPKDVRIRTMESDIKSMALRGGGKPEYENITLVSEPKRSEGEEIPDSKKAIRNFWTVSIALGAAVLLGAIVYFAYPLFVSPPDSNGTDGGVSPPPADDGNGLPPVPPHLTIPKFEHRSFFGATADQMLELVISSKAEEPSDLENYDQKILNLLSEIDADSKLVEVNIKKDDKQHLALTEFLEIAGAEILGLDFLAGNFNPDFTLFIYKDGDEFWLGLIAKLKPDKSSLLLKPEVAKLEKSKNLNNLFLQAPGSSGEKFEDILVVGQPARSLKFSKSSANFIYGWFHSFLVLSTSEAGLREAVRRL